MAFDSLKGSVSDHKEKRTDLKSQKDDLAIEIGKADDMISGASGLDDSVLAKLRDVRTSFDAHEAELEQIGDQLDKERIDLQKKINNEQEKLDSVQRKIDGLSGKKYTGGLDDVSNKCDSLLSELDDLLADLDGDEATGSASDLTGRSSNIVKIGGDSYRVDDDGNIHMKRGKDNEYHVLPNTKYTVNGYTYQSDEKGRIIHCEGSLKVKDGSRASLNAKVSGMGKKDQRGHILADIFGGSNQNDNLVAQLQSINQGAYKTLELNLASMVSSGHDVYGDYTLDYPTSSKRPSAITVNYSIDGGMPVSQVDTFSKFGLTDIAGYTDFENNLLNLREQGNTVDCNYSVVFSNNRNTCWVFVEYTVNGGFPIVTQFL